MKQLKHPVFQLSRLARAALQGGSTWLAGWTGSTGRGPVFKKPFFKGPVSRRLALEPLEPRLTLAAAGLVDVGSQPVGALSGKIVYTHGGHGITADNLGNGAWSFQRPLLLNMIEDLGNQDQMSFFADTLFRAGATVVPLRPVGHQSHEVVLDNDDAQVTFSGAWSNSSSSIYFGDAGDVPYRTAPTSATETAYARYRPNITAAGFYPVYAWTPSGSNRASDQLYRVNHSGGITEVTVNHRRVGNGLVYLGTYHFAAGTGGYVDISNRSGDAGKVVVADMIRFGNGVGDIDRGGGTSGRDREDEAGLYWVQWHVDHSQGIATSAYRTASKDRDATVSLSPRYAEFMNNAADGALSDRVFVSFHSNAGSGNSRGVLGLYNGNNNPNTATPNQFLLASTLGREVNDDLVDQNGQFEHNWFDQGPSSSDVTLDRTDIEFGEINNLRINGEFDATIVEVAYHDNSQDAELLRAPKVRAAVARATTQGVVKYFHQVDAGATPLAFAPGQVGSVQAVTAGPDSVTVSWIPAAANSYNGDAATGYRVYGSTDGYGFDGGTSVAGGGATSYTFSGLDPDQGAYYFKVAAVNAGGESPASEVLAAIPGAGEKDVLIVSGFDRLDRTQDLLQAGDSSDVGLAQRVRPRQSNSFDYPVQVAAAIEAVSPDLVVDTASNEVVISGAVELADYTSVIWILGEESSADHTFDATEQTLVADYLAGGGKLFVSGAEIGWDLDHLNHGRAFYNNQLRADYVADDAGTYNVTGAAGSIFTCLTFSFDNGAQFYDVNFPDVLTPLAGATTALTYAGGTGGGAAVQYTDPGASQQLVMLAFPFETITDQAVRTAVMGNVLDYFGFATIAQTVELILDNDAGPPVYTETGSWSTSTSTGYNGSTYRFTPAGTTATAQWQFNAPFAGQGEVFVQYRSGSNRTSDTRYQIETGSGLEFASINQKIDNLQWVSLGTYDFTPGSHTMVLDAQASSGGSVVIADAARVVLSSVPPTSADFDQDADIDGRDFLAWQRGFGLASGAEISDGDADADGDVDATDLQVWQTTFGQSAAQNLAAPETLAAFSAVGRATKSSSVSARIPPVVAAPWQEAEKQAQQQSPGKIFLSPLVPGIRLAGLGFISQGSQLGNVLAATVPMQIAAGRQPRRAEVFVTNSAQTAQAPTAGLHTRTDTFRQVSQQANIAGLLQRVRPGKSAIGKNLTDLAAIDEWFDRIARHGSEVLFCRI